MDREWNAVRAAAGLPTLRIHDFRHSHTAIAVNGGEGLRVGTVVCADIARFFHEYGRRKPGGANRCHEILRNMFDCAIVWGQRPEAAGTPCTGIVRYRRPPRGRLFGAVLRQREDESPVCVAAVRRLHDLRHAHASHGVMNGESLHVAGRLLGHRRATTTNRYVHLDDATLSQAAERVAASIQAKLSVTNSRAMPAGEA